MKIVMAANWWYRRGGLGAVMLDEAHALAGNGHDIIPFAAAHPDNLPTPYSRYFPAFRETQDAGRGMGIAERGRTAVRLLYNRDAASRFARLLDDERPDLVHLHNATRQLSPSIVLAARSRGTPVVITAHDYSLICPQGRLYRGDRIACEPPNCMRGDVYHAVVDRCVKQSRAASGIAAVEHLVHRSLGLYTNCERILAPSAFLARMLARAGLPARRVSVLENGIAPGSAPSPVPRSRGHILFSGRLAREKGLEVLVAAASLMPDVRFVVAGDGPEGVRLSTIAPANVSLVGHQGQQALAQLLEDAVAVVMPSTWYENAPISLLEAFRAGRPVIASDIGGHPEMLSDGGGVLVPAGDGRSLANAIRGLWDDREAAADLGITGRRILEGRFSLERHMSRLEAHYRDVVATRVVGART